MVLSNKKLKQKLRSLLAESLATTESKSPPTAAAAAAGGGGGGGDVNQQLQSLRELRSSKSQKPNSSKRPKRKKKPALPTDSAPGEGAESTQNENSKTADSSAVNEKDKSKKRKRVGDGDQASAEKKPKNKKKKPKKNKERKKEKKPKDEKNGKGSEGTVDDGSNMKGAAAPEEGNEDVNANAESKVEGTAEPTTIDEIVHDPKKVYVGGIPYYSSEDDITSFFEKCGTITEMDCMTFPETGKFRGIAILTFKTDAAAKRALALDGEDMGGFYLKIQPYKAVRTQKSDFAPEIIDGYNRIYAGNLSWDITEDDLRKLFSECKVSTIRFGEDKETGEFKGYAHVDFSDSASLAAALKLDQEIVCGRPVRIRCAVSKKGAEAASSLKASGKKEEDDLSTKRPKRKKGPCYQCGITGHLASACPQRTGEAGATETRETDSITKPALKVEGDAAVEQSKKRRTCYECGIPGHLSSDCPKKKTAEAGEETETYSSSKPAARKVEEDAGVGQAKKKRRTCYECGIPGHLSSDCPNKKTAAAGATDQETETYSSSKPTVGKVEEDMVVGQLKKKRQTCYECGIAGHISSDCPKKTAAAGATEEAEGYSSWKPAAKVEEGVSGGKSKKKRRTCYECGVPGHLSTDCPTKKPAEGGSVDNK